MESGGSGGTPVVGSNPAVALFIMRIIGIDPGLSYTGWCAIEMTERQGKQYAKYITHGTEEHGLIGRGQWKAKIASILTGLEEHMLPKIIQYETSVIIEKPHYGDRGRGAVIAVALVAIMDLAYQIKDLIHERYQYGVPVKMLTPDRYKKSSRAVGVSGLIADFPKRTNEHVRDAGWIALRK